MQYAGALSQYPIMSINHDELTYRIITAQENDEYINHKKSFVGWEN